MLIVEFPSSYYKYIRSKVKVIERNKTKVCRSLSPQSCFCGWSQTVVSSKSSTE